MNLKHILGICSLISLTKAYTCNSLKSELSGLIRFCDDDSGSVTEL